MKDAMIFMLRTAARRGSKFPMNVPKVAFISMGIKERIHRDHMFLDSKNREALDFNMYVLQIKIIFHVFFNPK